MTKPGKDLFFFRTFIRILRDKTIYSKLIYFNNDDKKSFKMKSFTLLVLTNQSGKYRQTHRGPVTRINDLIDDRSKGILC